jgi:ABC-type amino acid transport substrate-binding protein
LEIAKLKNVKFLIYKVNRDSLLPSLEKRKCIAILSSKYPHIFDKEKYSFSASLLLIGPVLVFKEGSYNTSLDDMDGKLVGYVKKSYLSLLRKGDILVKEYLNIPDALNDVRSGYLNAALIERIKALNFVNNLYGDLKTTKSITDEGLRLISHIEDEEFIEFFNKALKELEKSGKLKKLQKKWSLLF